MTTVWLVTDGAYSDYHVVAICSDKKVAKSYLRNCQDRSYAEMTEWELDTELQVPLPLTVEIMVRQDVNNQTGEITLHYWPWGMDGSVAEWGRPNEGKRLGVMKSVGRYSTGPQFFTYSNITYSITEPDEETLRKVVTEQCAALKAEIELIGFDAVYAAIEAQNEAAVQ